MAMHHGYQGLAASQHGIDVAALLSGRQAMPQGVFNALVAIAKAEVRAAFPHGVPADIDVPTFYKIVGEHAGTAAVRPTMEHKREMEADRDRLKAALEQELIKRRSSNNTSPPSSSSPLPRPPRPSRPVPPAPTTLLVSH